MKKSLWILGLSVLILLSGCLEENSNLKDSIANGQTTSENLDLLNQELEDITAEEWASIHLSKSDFDHFLSSLSKKDEEGFQEISEVTMKSSTIIIVLNNKDGETLDNLLSAPFLDTKVRQAYLQSVYFDGQHPTIRIIDQAGTVLSDTAEPLDLVDPEA